MSLTPDAKKLLAETIRGSAQDPDKGLRARLLRAIHDEADRRYRLSVSVREAGLDEAHRRRRERLEAWVDERARATKPKTKADLGEAKERLLAQAEKEAAATLINRLVLLRHLEALGLSKPAVVTGGWNSKGYREFREFAPALCTNGTTDASEGYATLLQLLFDELAVDLPGLFGDVGLTRLFPIPASTLREVIERLDDPDLASAWTDDTTLGWVYQYWNDPDREALDAKINGGGKIEPHEIASKTQMFTERYMVEWLLQNSLGLTWLSMCKARGFTADAERVLPVLDARRAAFRKKRDAGEVALDALMPIEGPLEEQWKYYVPQPIPDDAVARAPASVRAIRILDPACGSGHFLVIAFDLLTALYREEARHTGTSLDDRAIAESILENNLYGIDIDPRATQIAAAGLYLKAKALAKDARPRRLNLVAPVLQLGNLPEDDAAVAHLRADLKREAGIPEALTDRLLKALAGVDYLGSLLKVDAAVEEAIKAAEGAAQGELFGGSAPRSPESPGISRESHAVRATPGAVTSTPSAVTSTPSAVTSTSGAVTSTPGAVRATSSAVTSTPGAVRATSSAVTSTPGAVTSTSGTMTATSPAVTPLSLGDAKATILDKLEQFLAKHSKSEDLGLRLDGEQLAAGVRFVRMAKEGTYDLVVGNPPYQGITKTNAFGYVAATYPRGKADLYAAFLERGLELARDGGMSALLTMRGWMFVAQFVDLRKHLLKTHDLRSVSDFDRGAFDDVPNEVLAVCVPIFRRRPHPGVPSVAAQPTPLDDKSYDRQRTNRKRAAVLAQVGRYEFDPRGFAAIESEPIVYWWTKLFVERYRRAPKLGSVAPVRQGMATTDNSRFVRKPWEVGRQDLLAVRYGDPKPFDRTCLPRWVPIVKGAAGACWFESLDDAVLWEHNGLEVKVCNDYGYGSFSRNVKNEAYYFRPGVAFSMIGNAFVARAHRYRSVIADMGSSAFPVNVPETVCLMNAKVARRVLSALNPTLHFLVGDVNRLPMFPIEDAGQIYGALDRAFEIHEGARETSVEFRGASPSAWESAQRWGQAAVDRAVGAQLPPWDPACAPPQPESQVSFCVGVVLGRFGAHGDGVVLAAPATAVPRGILFVPDDGANPLSHPACAPLHAAWAEHGPSISPGDDLSTYLRKSFFDYHKKLYENRPIYFPLSSVKKSFVAFVSIHRWADDTLSVLLADHLVPTRRRLEGELDDLRSARAAGGSNKGKVEKRFAEVQKLLEELSDFVAKVTEVAEKGPPPPDDKTRKRDADARYTMDLDDGVMVNSSPLWPLLEPQWKDPKKWWKELANAQGKKDYDWSHLAARYFPDRVRKKCHDDPSLAVAHKCFWELHPAKAYAWELRLQDEIRPDFTIDEPGSDAARARFLAEHEREAGEIRAKEAKRREKKGAKGEDEGDGPLYEDAADQDAEAPDA